MKILKHIGKIKDTNEKIVILFNEVPNEIDNCLVVKTASLNDVDHDELMLAVESHEGQSAHVLGEVVNSRMNRAGRPLLTSLHDNKKIEKVTTDTVLLTPNNRTEIVLREMNDMLRGQARSRGDDDFIGNSDLASNVSAPSTVKVEPVNNMSSSNDVNKETETLQTSSHGHLLTDEDIGQSLLNQSLVLRKEADKLLEEAIKLNPELVPKKPVTKKKKTKKPSLRTTKKKVK